MRQGQAGKDVRGKARGVGVAILGCCLIAALAGPVSVGASVKVFRVGTYNGVKGGYKTIQSAINAASPGDWILVGPGDYKEAATTVPTGGDGAGAGVLVQKPGLHIRGMD